MGAQSLQDVQLTSGDGKKLKPILIEFFESFEFKMHELFTAMKTAFQQICQQNNDRIQSLEDEVRTLNKKVKKLEEKFDESEEYSRRDTIILSGNDLPAGSSTENCTQVVMDIVKSKLKVTINPCDISIAHRIGKSLANKPRQA